MSTVWNMKVVVNGSRASQKEKNKYHILMHICGARQNDTDDLIWQNRIRDTGVENKYMNTRGERGCGGRNWEVGIDTYALSILYTKYVTSENIPQSTGNSI